MDVAASAADVAQHDPLERYASVRNRSEAVCAPLAVEDYGVQPMEAASPPKWHLAHTTWFFESFLLTPFASGYTAFHPRYEYLFNSYYNGVGELYPRPRRGMLSRPTLDEVLDYRRHVDRAMRALLARCDAAEVLGRLVLGLNHEQQHQELILTDLKYNLGLNPLMPAYRGDLQRERASSAPHGYVGVAGGEVWIGADEGAGFIFDNEAPRHRLRQPPFEIGNRLVTNGEYLEFIEAGGYDDPLLWLSDGFESSVAARWRSPLYWHEQDGAWHQYTLGGSEPLDPDAPVVHVSFYEADAYARFRGARLPTEAEWERVAGDARVDGNFYERGTLTPAAWHGPERIGQLFGDAWEWTASSYAPYPGYRPLPGTLGEYNGKFMCNQMVLRGGSCVTPSGHVRASYRNFFYPGDRWQFSGIRLARTVAGG